MKTILLADCETSGHRRVWLAAITESLLQLGHHVVLLLPESKSVLALIESQVEDTTNLTCHVWNLPELKKRNGSYLSNLRAMLWRWHSLRQHIRSLPRQPDLVILPYLDAFVCHGLLPQLLNRVFPVPWYGIYFQPQWTRINTAKHSKRPGFLFETVAVQSKHCRGVGILDEGVPHLFADKHGRTVDCFPDFIHPPIQEHASELGKQVRARAGDRTVVSFLGTIQSRKGFEAFLRLLDTADPERTYFLIAGKFSFTQKRYSKWTLEYWDKINNKSPENVMIHDGVIEDDQDYYDLFRQSDAIWGAYENWPHSSNVLTLAAAFKKPILVSDGYLMAERVRAFGLGRVLSEDQSGKALCATLELISNEHSMETEFSQMHSSTRLQTLLASIVSRQSSN